jgi:hypothetical protein
MTLEVDVIFGDDGKPALDENGRVRVKYTWTASHDGHTDDDGCGVIETGPARGVVRLDDGTAYDVTPDLVEHLPGHHVELTEKIRENHRLRGSLPEVFG